VGLAFATLGDVALTFRASKPAFLITPPSSCSP
jgi:hypothetical protein